MQGRAKHGIRKIFYKILLVVMLSALLLAGCSNNENMDQQVALTVGAAASLQGVLDEMGQEFAKNNSDIVVQFTYSSSGILQQQIEQGSPIDVYISAGKKQMDILDSNGYILAGSRSDLVYNEVVLVVPGQSNSTLTSFGELTNDNVKKIALGNPATVPAGQYGQEVLEFYSLYDTIEGKIVLAEDVRQALAMVGTGNADAGLVYLTDAQSNPQVRIVDLASQESHSPIVYSIGIINSTEKQDAAKRWVEYCLSADGQAVFAEYGFTTLDQRYVD